MGDRGPACLTAVELLASEGPGLIETVLEGTAGVRFDRSPDGLPAWGREGAHSHRRILHVGDATGQAVITGLIDAVRARPDIRLMGNATAIDLITFPRAIHELRHLKNEIETFYRSTKLADGLIGLRNAVEVALIVAEAARHNRRSRGSHFRRDAMQSDGDRLI